MFRLGKKRKDHYASFSRRMWAATVDSLLVLFFILPFFEMALISVYPIPESTGNFAVPADGDSAQVLAVLWKNFYASGLFTRWLVDIVLQTIIIFALTAYCWRRWSATPGKMLFRLKVVDATTEQPLSMSQIYLRLWGYIVASLPLFLGFVWISFNRKRQGWHDKMAHSVVIIVPRKTKSDSAAARP